MADDSAAFNECDCIPGRECPHPPTSAARGPHPGKPEHPHDMPEEWRDDGKCIWKSCRVRRDDTTATVTVTVRFPMGKFDVHRTGSRYDVTNVIREVLMEHNTFNSAEVRYDG